MSIAKKNILKRLLQNFHPVTGKEEFSKLMRKQIITLSETSTVFRSSAVSFSRGTSELTFVTSSISVDQAIPMSFVSTNDEN